MPPEYFFPQRFFQISRLYWNKMVSQERNIVRNCGAAMELCNSARRFLSNHKDLEFRVAAGLKELAPWRPGQRYRGCRKRACSIEGLIRIYGALNGLTSGTGGGMAAPSKSLDG
jgi:hypothetical protein